MYKKPSITFVILICFALFIVGCNGNLNTNNTAETDTDEKPEWLFVAETDNDSVFISTQLRIVSADNCIVFYKTIPQDIEKRRKDKKMLQQTKRWAEYEYTLYTEEFNLKTFQSRLLEEYNYSNGEVILSTTYNEPKWAYLLPNTIGEDLCNEAKEIRKKYYYKEVEEYSRK